MKEIVIVRNKYLDKQTLGFLFIIEENGIIFQCKTLELGWKDNKSKVSCIPKGKYEAKKEYSISFKEDLFELKDVPGRSEIKIHSANYYTQLKGCIGIGDSYAELNNDGYLDVLNSRKTLRKLHAIIGDQKWIQVNIYGEY